MARRRLRLIWGGAEKIPGHWRLGLWGVYERQVGSPPRIAISLRGLLCWVGGLALAGYLAGATALYGWFQRHPYNLVTWTDTLLLPVRWAQVRELRGRMIIEEGLADYRARRWAEAHMKLRVGLARAPHDLRARLALAEFYSLANRRPSALTVLTEDLASGYPGRRYLTTLFTIATQGEDFEVVVETCDRFLPQETPDRDWLLTQKIQALIGLRRLDEALRLGEAEGEQAPALVREGRVLALVELGRPGDALARLEQWLQARPANRPHVLRLQVRAFREAGRLAEMEAALEALRQLAPADPRTAVYGVVQKALAGADTGADEALNDFIRRFGGSAQNLALVTSALAEAKAAELVQRCVEEAAAHGFPDRVFLLSLAQVQIEAGRWAAAARTIARLENARPEPTPAETFVVNWLERLVAVAARSDEGPRLALLELFQQRPLPMRLYRVTAETLVRAGRFETAGAVLDLAERTYPASRTLAAVRAEAAAGVATTAPVAVASKIVARAVDEVEFFEQLAADETAARWSAAAAALRRIRLNRPAWLDRREGDVLAAQMRVAARLDDTAELLAAARLYLNGDRARSQVGVALARELHTSRPEMSARLVQEVLRASPGFPPAVRLEAEWRAAAGR